MSSSQTTVTTTPCLPAVTIRRAGPDDATTVHALVLEIAAHEGDLHHVRVTAARWARLLRREDVVVLLAARGSRVLGYVSAVRRLHLWTGGDVLAVDDVFVRPGERGDGVGRRLLTAVAALAEPEGLHVTWGVEPGNAGAQRLYARLGATLRHKVVAGWAPEVYRDLVTEEVAREVGQERDGDVR
jgi:GNAT superfamily N-acetyltransferase